MKIRKIDEVIGTYFLDIVDDAGCMRYRARLESEKKDGFRNRDKPMYVVFSEREKGGKYRCVTFQIRIRKMWRARSIG